MSSLTTNLNLAQAFQPVKSLQGAALSSNRPPGQPTALTSPLQLNTQLPLFPDTMIHHSNVPRYILRGNRDKIWRGTGYYGVSLSRRVLSPQILLKRFDHVRDCLKYALGLSPGQREVALRLLKFWAYYGNVYVKEALITEEPGCSKATYWRTLRVLQSLGLVQVIHRFMTPFRRQISNIYRLDKLIMLIARYLAEHGQFSGETWLLPVIMMTWRSFWDTRLSLALPGDPGGAGGPT